MIKIYIADVSDLSINTEILKTLPDIRVKKINKLQNDKEKVLSYGAGLLIDKFILYGNKDAYFVHPDGKPYTSRGLCFSVSHSGNFVVLAVSDKEIGCDIQKCSQRNFERIAKFVFHKNEIELLNSSEDKTTVFFEIWTKKEAFLKHLGTGFNIKATDIDLSQDNYDKNGKTYFFANRKIEEYFISVCYEERNADIEYNIVTLK